MRKNEEDALQRQQNKIRGALGVLRRHADPAARRINFRTALRKVLVRTRVELPLAQRAAFFDWLERLSNSELMAGAPLAGDLTSSVIRAKTISVPSELDWLAYRLRPHIQILKKFRELATALDECLWNDDWGGCRQLLDEIETTFGATLWHMNAKIALNQLFEGLEAQKGYANDVRDRYSGGMPAYLAFYMSVRNEQKSTYTLFNEDYRDRLENEGLTSDLREYLEYKVLGEFLHSDAGISSVLMYEQAQSIIDLYEVVVDLLQRTCIHAGDVSWGSAAAAFVSEFRGVDDWRLAKIEFALTGRGTPNALAPISLDDPLAEFTRWAGKDAWRAIWPLLENTSCLDGADKDDQRIRLRTAALLRSVISRDGSFEESVGRLLKFSRNFAFSSFAAALGDATRFLTLQAPNNRQMLGAIALKSPCFGPCDSLYVNRSALHQAERFLGRDFPDDLVGMWLSEQDPAVPAHVQPVKWYLRALRHSGPTDNRLAILESIPERALSDGQRVLVSNLRIELHLGEGERNEAIALISREIATSPAVSFVMPVREAIGGRDWEDLVRVPDKLDLALCLLAYWRQTDESLYGTFLRFAFEEVLIQLGVDLPSRISVPTAGREKIVSFLANVCVPVLMDTSGLFASTDELLNERLEILANLAAEDPDNSDAYIEEGSEIRASKIIKSGLQIVDSNRVNVDSDALFRWASKRYNESYLRYLSLAKANIGVSASFDDIMLAIRQVTDSKGEYFSIPKSEADTLLLEMILEFQKRFLEDPSYGLEFYLGKRIRHGSLAGHMRGPVEAAALITERPGPSLPYEPNTEWLGQFAFIDSEARANANAAFQNFSEKYDELIAYARDQKLHVRSSSHPNGIFSVSITTVQYHLIKSVLNESIDFETFLSVCINMCWGLLIPSLEDARLLLTDEVKFRAVGLFDELRDALRCSAEDGEALRNCSTAIQSASTEVQRQLDIVASWFNRVESRQAAHLFSLREVFEVAISSALKTLTTFRPEVDLELSGDRQANASVMMVVSDIVFVVLDNVYRRARAGPSPNIGIFCHLDTENALLEVCFRNPVGETIDKADLERRLETLRSKIAAGDIVRGAAADRGSGLLKIASLTRQYSKASLDFRLVDGATFETAITMPVQLIDDRFSFPLPEIA